MKLWQRIRREFEPKVGRILAKGGHANWLYRFDRPSDAAMGRIREILQSAEMVAHVDRQAPKDRRRKNALAETTLEDAIRLIKTAIERDYAANVQELAEKSFDFDYVVSLNAPYAGNVAIWTRYFNRTNPKLGNVYYGSEVRRIGRDQYLLWDSR